MGLTDRIGQPINIDSTILYLGDKQIYYVDGLSAQKVRVRMGKVRRASSLWPENCLVIDENLWAMAREGATADIAERYWSQRKELLA